MWLKSTLHSPFHSAKVTFKSPSYADSIKVNPPPPFLPQLVPSNLPNLHVGKSSSRINITSCRMAPSLGFMIHSLRTLKRSSLLAGLFSFFFYSSIFSFAVRVIFFRKFVFGEGVFSSAVNISIKLKVE